MHCQAALNPRTPAPHGSAPPLRLTGLARCGKRGAPGRARHDHAKRRVARQRLQLPGHERAQRWLPRPRRALHRHKSATLHTCSSCTCSSRSTQRDSNMNPQLGQDHSWGFPGCAVTDTQLHVNPLREGRRSEACMPGGTQRPSTTSTCTSVQARGTSSRSCAGGARCPGCPASALPAALLGTGGGCASAAGAGGRRAARARGGAHRPADVQLRHDDLPAARAERHQLPGLEHRRVQRRRRRVPRPCGPRPRACQSAVRCRGAGQRQVASRLWKTACSK